MTTHGGMFDGGGGLHLAVEAVFGAETIWHCEKDTAASRVLAWNWPDVPNWSDINSMRPGEAPLADILTGGFPCQDVSVSGRRAGLAPGTRSGLWAKMHAVVTDQTRRALTEGRCPPLVIVENVRGLLSATAHSHVESCPDCLGDPETPSLRALGAVLGDLADLGFDAEWGLQSAGAVGLAHLRERVFIVARHRESRGRPDAPAPIWGREGVWASGGPDRHAADPGRLRGLEGRPPGPGEAPRGRARSVAAGRRLDPAADPDHHRPHEGLAVADRWGVVVGRGDHTQWGRWAPAIRRAEVVIGRPAPPPSVVGGRGARRMSPRFVEWHMGWPEGHVTDVPDITSDDMHRILGNGVAPQAAAWAIPRLYDRLD